MARPVSAETPPSSANTESEMEAKQEEDSPVAPPSELPAQSEAVATAATEAPSPPIKDQQVPPSLLPGETGTATLAEEENKVSDEVGDTVDSPIGPSASLAAQETPTIKEEPQAAPPEKAPEKEEVKKDAKKLEKEEKVASATLKPAVEVAATVAPVNVAKEETAASAAPEVCQPPPSVQQPAAPQPTDNDPHTATNPEPVPVQTAEPPLSNGLPQETEELSEGLAVSDTTPHDKPDTSQSQESKPVAKTATPAQEEKEKKEEQQKKTEDVPPTSVSCLEESTMQSMLDVFLVCI